MITLKVKNSKFWNGKLSIPFDGVVEVDAEGNVEVSEQAAEVLLQSPEDFIDPGKPVAEEAEADVENEDAGDAAVQLTLEEINAIDQLTVKQLKALAQRYEVKGFEKISDKKKQVIVAFLKNTLSKRIK